MQTLSPSRTFSAVAENGRDVVLKVLDDACLVDGDLHPDIRQRLARVRELAVPGVANLLSVERAGPHAYLVWDFVKGISLADWLAKKPDRSQRLLAARELVLIVESLHAAGIVHGAIHPRNIYRDAQGRLWLTHVSPLLLNDAAEDVERLNDLLRAMLVDAPVPHADSLRQLRLSLAGLIDSREVESAEALPDDTESRRRRWMMLTAVGVAILAGIISYFTWRWAKNVPPPAEQQTDARTESFEQ